MSASSEHLFCKNRLEIYDLRCLQRTNNNGVHSVLLCTWGIGVLLYLFPFDSYHSELIIQLPCQCPIPQCITSTSGRTIPSWIIRGCSRRIRRTRLRSKAPVDELLELNVKIYLSVLWHTN